jgi:hypothetical protein
VDASQGIQAQTLSNLFLALDAGLEIIPVLHKIDLPGAEPERRRAELVDLLAVEPEEVLDVSAKEGWGVAELLETVIQRVPPPRGEADSPLRALIFDSLYDKYQGAVPNIRVVDGALRKGMRITFGATDAEYEVDEVGCLRLGRVALPELGTGEVGYVIAGIKRVSDTKVGDTILDASNPARELLPGYREVKPMVFSGLYPTDTEHYEAQFVAEDIDRLTDAGDSRPGEVAVFYRTNAQSRVFEEIFIRVGLPYKVVGGVRFYERKEVRDVLAYLRVLANGEDAVSLRRILNVPKRGIGDRAEAMIEALALREKITFPQALRRVDEAYGMAARSANAVKRFNALLEELSVVAESGAGPATVLEAVLERTGYLAELQSSTDPQDETRVENLQELAAVAPPPAPSSCRGSAGAGRRRPPCR